MRRELEVTHEAIPALLAMDTFKFSDSFTFSHFNTTLRSSTVLATPQLDRSARRAPESIAGTSDLTYSVKQKGLPPSLLKAQQQEQARTDTEEYGKFFHLTVRKQCLEV